MAVALVAHRRTSTNVALAACSGVEVLSPVQALRTLAEGDVAIGRLDVSERLDGIEAGLWELARLEGSGVRVLNRPGALVAAHDKLATARALAAAGRSASDDRPGHRADERGADSSAGGREAPVRKLGTRGLPLPGRR